MLAVGGGWGCNRGGEPSFPPRFPVHVGPDFDNLANAPRLFAGELTAVQAGPVARSMPPIHSFTLTFDVAEVFRGDFAYGQSLTVHLQARQVEPPSFTVGETYLVVADWDKRIGKFVGSWTKAADDKLLIDARQAGRFMPIGWRVEDKRAVSPWAVMGRSAWPANLINHSHYACAVTERGPRLVGKGITLTCEPVPPAKAVKWSNPDGDGEFTITVTNTNGVAVDVPALISDEDEILWNESLVVLCQGTARPAPLAKGVSSLPRQTRLEPGQSVSTVVNALRLKDVEWPRGGYRVEFTFCLGELATTQSFYYKSDHHDPIREASAE